VLRDLKYSEDKKSSCATWLLSLWLFIIIRVSKRLGTRHSWGAYFYF
jgi:hypothetical protein